MLNSTFFSDILYAYVIFMFTYDFRNGYLNVLTGYCSDLFVNCVLCNVDKVFI